MVLIDERRNFSTEYKKKIAAASLVFWMSGILFLFCCETARVEAGGVESCPLGKARHYSKQIAGGDGSHSASIEAAQHVLRGLPNCKNSEEIKQTFSF